MSRLIKFRRKYFLMCADDFTSLRLALRAYRSHPLTGGVNSFFEASICRLLIVNRVDFVEGLLEYGSQLDEHEVLDAYFPPPDENGRKVPNRERVDLLRRAFADAGFTIDEAVFDRYLALKLLRIFIVHGNLNPNEETFVEQQGFLSDLEKLDLKHANEVIRVSSELARYVLETKPRSQDADWNHALSTVMRESDLLHATGFNPQELDRTLDDDLGLVKRSDIARMFWNNLEKISERLETPNLGVDEVKVLSSAAEESWSEFWRITFTSNFIEIGDLERATKFFARYHLNDYNGLTTEESNSSFIIGKDAEKAMPNVTAVALFLKQLPKIDPNNTSKYRVFGQQAFAVWEAAYFARKHPTSGSDFDYDHLETYRSILNAE